MAPSTRSPGNHGTRFPPGRARWTRRLARFAVCSSPSQARRDCSGRGPWRTLVSFSPLILRTKAKGMGQLFQRVSHFVRLLPVCPGCQEGWGRAIDRQINEGGFSFCLENGQKVTAPGRLMRCGVCCSRGPSSLAGYLSFESGFTTPLS